MNPATTEAKYHRGQDPSIWHYGHSVVRVSQNHQPLSRDGVPKIGLSKITPARDPQQFGGWPEIKVGST